MTGPVHPPIAILVSLVFVAALVTPGCGSNGGGQVLESAPAPTALAEPTTQPTPTSQPTPAPPSEQAISPTPTADPTPASAPASGAAQTYELIELGSLGGYRTHARDISSDGLVVGWDFDQSNQARGIVWGPGSETIRELETLGGAHSRANAINDGGLVVGYSDTADSEPDYGHAALWDLNSDSVVDLGLLDPTRIESTEAIAINATGVIVGHVFVPTEGEGGAGPGLANSFVFDPATGEMTDLGQLGCEGCMVHDVDDLGRMTVTRSNRELTAALVFDPATGATTPLEDLGGGWAVARALNNHGQAAGQCLTATGDYQACWWEPNGTVHTLGTPGSESNASDINENGLIVGLVVQDTGGTHAYLWSTESNEGIDLDDGRGTVAAAINNDGLIAGFSEQALLWRPRP